MGGSSSKQAEPSCNWDETPHFVDASGKRIHTVAWNAETESPKYENPIIQ